MNPHLDKLSLIQSTNLYEVELKYCKYMRELSGKVGSLFVGRKMRVNDEVFLVRPQK